MNFLKIILLGWILTITQVATAEEQQPAPTNLKEYLITLQTKVQQEKRQMFLISELNGSELASQNLFLLSKLDESINMAVEIIGKYHLENITITPTTSNAELFYNFARKIDNYQDFKEAHTIMLIVDNNLKDLMNFAAEVSKQQGLKEKAL